MERLQYIDTAKGLAIVSIILLHFEDGIFPPQLNLSKPYLNRAMEAIA